MSIYRDLDHRSFIAYKTCIRGDIPCQLPCSGTCEKAKEICFQYSPISEKNIPGVALSSF